MTLRKSYHGLIVIFLLCISFFNNTQASGYFTTLKSAMKNETTNEAYIAAGYPFNRAPFKNEIDRLWDSINVKPNIDTNGQQWKKVDIKSLKDIVGDFPTTYIVISPIEKIKTINNKRLYVVDHFNVTTKQVKNVALFKWGCDDSVIPVLNLGEWPKNASDWGPVALSRGNANWRHTQQKPVIGELDASLVPPILQPKTGDLMNIGLSVNWPNEKLIASLIYSRIDNDYQLFSVGRGFSYLKSKSPFDSRC